MNKVYEFRNSDDIIERISTIKSIKDIEDYVKTEYFTISESDLIGTITKCITCKPICVHVAIDSNIYNSKNNEIKRLIEITIQVPIATQLGRSEVLYLTYRKSISGDDFTILNSYVLALNKLSSVGGYNINNLGLLLVDGINQSGSLGNENHILINDEKTLTNCAFDISGPVQSCWSYSADIGIQNNKEGLTEKLFNCMVKSIV